MHGVNIVKLQTKFIKEHNQMKKVEAVAQFRQMWKEAVAWNPRLKNDTVARRCEFNDYVDYLQKDGHITEYQAYNWSNPF